jgi:hypothetical protein
MTILRKIYPVDDGTPRWRDIVISNVIAHGAADAGDTLSCRWGSLTSAFNNVFNTFEPIDRVQHRQRRVRAVGYV